MCSRVEYEHTVGCVCFFVVRFGVVGFLIGLCLERGFLYDTGFGKGFLARGLLVSRVCRIAALGVGLLRAPDTF